MTADPQTIAIYDDKIGDYSDAFANVDMAETMASFVAALPIGGSVLDLGCGPGAHGGYLKQLGFDVTAIDASEAMVAYAKAKYGLRAFRAAFDELAETEAYDGVWAHFSLLHAPRNKFPAHLLAVARALKPNGIFHIGMKTGAGEKRDTLGRFYTFYTEEELCSALENAGFAIINVETGEGAGLAGTVDPWVEILSRRTA